MSALNFCSHIPYLMSFLSCFPLHNYLMFAWFYVQFLLLSLSSNFPSFSAHFILFSTPYLPYFCFVLCSIFITELEFELYIIFSPGSWHVVRLRPNIFILSQSDQLLFSVLLQVYKSLFHHLVPSNVQPCTGFKFPHSSSLLATTASHFVRSSLVDQLNATVTNCVTKSNNPVQYAPNIHPNVFNSFHRTIIHGESQGIFTTPCPSNDTSPHFTLEPLPSVTYPFFLIRTRRTVEKQIHILPSWKTITDCLI